jgi:hypothetical protein
MAKATTAFVSKPLLRRYFDICEQTIAAGTNAQNCRSRRTFALAEAADPGENAYAGHRCRHETLYRRVFELLPNVPIDSHGHCLEAGGQHTEQKHFSLMMACAEMCRTSAHFMVIGSELHKRTCRLCSEICERCAADCNRIGEMKECADMCRRCAESCKKMAA